MPSWGQATWPSLCGFSAAASVTSASNLAALDKGDPSVADNDGEGEDEYNFDK